MDCKGAIIVPYRDREQHLTAFLYHMARFQRQHELNLPIFIIEQIPGKYFNRAKLFNVGVHIILNLSGDKINTEFNYFAFHDVDMLPAMADYSYPQYPTHIATHCSQFGYKMPDPNYFGGVTLVNVGHFIQVNGYSNDFWGWGYEDEEFRNRFIKKNIHITHRPCTFECFDHERPVHWSIYNQLKRSKKPLPPEYIQYESNKALHSDPDMSKGISTVEYKIIDQSRFKILNAVKYTVDL